MNKFHHAIVRTPCSKIVNGLSNNNLSTPDYKLALKQHEDYITALQSCNLTIDILEADDRFPDSVFVEDTAVCTSKFALISKPGAIERENEIDYIKPALKKHFNSIEFIKDKGTLDGGDVMMVDDVFYIGLSDRTNNEGADQFISILKNYGMKGIKVPLYKMLHLKTGLNYLENNNLLISGEFIENPMFNDFNKVIIEGEESYAANSLWVNDNVIVPVGYPETRKRIEKLGYKTLVVDTSEFRKVDGGLSCLSLRF